MGYPKYSWIGNQIKKEDMKKMVQIREKTGKPLTKIVSEAVTKYVEQKK